MPVSPSIHTVTQSGPQAQPVIIDGRYEILRRIARGGMTQVYVAHDRRLERDVALKIMHPYLAESDEFVRLFRREARAAARLTHPGVVAVYDQGTTGDSFYLTMEYVAGGNLRHLLQREGTLSLGRALELTEKIFSALAAAHQAGLVHRDVKPENVLLPTSGGVKVADFGLARAVSEASISGTGTVLGTVAYLAPEVVSDGGCPPAADVYAVGILLYEMLTGTPPFTGERPIQVAMKHVNEDVPLISQTLEWMPTEVDELVAALTARRLADRESDASTAMLRVRRVLADLPEDVRERRHELPNFQPLEQRPTKEEERLEPTERATQAITLDHTAALPRPAHTEVSRTQAGGIDTATDHPLVAVPVGVVQPGDKPVRQRRRRWPWLIVVLLLTIAGAATAWWFLLGPGSLRQLPDVTGKTEAEAVDIVRQAQFPVEVQRDYHDDVAAGLVISTDPAAGKIKKGRHVTILVSKGIRTIEVPTLVGVEAEAAKAAITDATGTLGEVTTDYSDDVPAGTVISASHEAGDVIAHNEPINLIVSSGPAPVTFPDLVGKSREEAEKTAGDAGLKVSVEEQFSDDVPAGHVISMNPPAGTEGHRLDALALVVSKGPELFDVPDVFGKQAPEARRILEEAGFQVRVEEILGGIFGTVRSQDPGAGNKLPKGATVTIKVV